MALLASILDDIHALTPDHIACTGDLVNIETDIIARHVERMRAFDGDTTTSQQGGNK